MLEKSTYGPFTRLRKICIDKPVLWDHHRGGWTYVCNLLTTHLHCDDGIEFITAVEDAIFSGAVFTDPWVGFLHQVPKHDLPWFPDLERLLQNEGFLASLPQCRGLFVLSSMMKDFLESRELPVPVARIFYPGEPTDRIFSFSRFSESDPRRLLFVGEYLRNYEAFGELAAPGYTKTLLRPENFKPERIARDPAIEILSRVPNDRYDALLQESVVFLNLYDAPAVTTVIECIFRATPVLINRLPGIAEYLGDEYPFFYDTLDEATEKLQDDTLIRQTVDYLTDLPMREKLTAEHFIDSLQSSAIYRSLPVPHHQQTEFKTYDVSFIVCSYKRVYNMDRLLRALADQDFEGTFEVLLWNNNYDARPEIDALYEKYRDEMNLRVIHSTENYYCIIRLAVASLIRSDVLMIVDDDVLPAPGYLSRFMQKREEYGPDAVLCCRGHVFYPHALDEEEPHRVWCEFQHMRFFDESAEDRRIHFFHADNCLIPKHVMQHAIATPIERYEYILIDDYWLSYVFSEKQKVPIWKIQADDVVGFTECADDTGVALFHNPKVNEQRINLYIDMMRKGWPHPPEVPSDTVQRAAEGEETPTKSAVWQAGFHGLNIFSEAPDADLKKIVDLGVRVVRMGAVGGTEDFRYLVDEAGENLVLDKKTVRRLISAIRRADEYGLKVILSLCNAPGRLVRQHDYDLRLWANPQCVDQFVEMWAELARHLRHFDNVIGYDLLNEPYTPDDSTSHILVKGKKSAYADDFYALYERTIEAIRRHDPRTPIVLESSLWASPTSVPFLRCSADPNVVYSFHMYLPPQLTNRSKNRGRYTYPGPIPEWDEAAWKGDQIFWDEHRIKEVLSGVVEWQHANNLGPHQIFVGEFGICREIAGANRYLEDLIEIFREYGWNWCVFSFRDEEWDAMNYELGPELANMSVSKENELMTILTKNFQTGSV